MPELPEVEALARAIGERVIGSRIASVDLASLSALKTVLPSPLELTGRTVLRVERFGKWLGLDADGLWLVVHLSRSGWIQWRDELPSGPVRPGKGPLALRVGFVSADGEPIGGIDITEAGTQKRLAVHVVDDPAAVPGIARLGPDPLSPTFTNAAFNAILDEAGRTQIKGVLRDQDRIAGIGNAYSDEVLHIAGISPFHPAATLTAEQRAALLDAIRTTLQSAIEAAAGHGTGTIKAEKKAGMRVHGRVGEACPACGDVIRSVSFADRSLEYCATCQTAGVPLADRRTSKFLK
jgi:formamidopyrimidine-DNA glycosylase